MVDSVDHAQEYEQAERERHIRRARQSAACTSRLLCEVCDTPIPEARRIAIPGVALCITCQQRREQQQRHYRRDM